MAIKSCSTKVKAHVSSYFWRLLRKKSCRRCREYFFCGKNLADIAWSISSAEETLLALSAEFLLGKKPCRQCRGIFGMPRNRVGVVGRFSGCPETVSALSVDFRDTPKIYRPNTELKAYECAGRTIAILFNQVAIKSENGCIGATIEYGCRGGTC